MLLRSLSASKSNKEILCLFSAYYSIIHGQVLHLSASGESVSSIVLTNNRFLRLENLNWVFFCYRMYHVTCSSDQLNWKSTLPLFDWSSFGEFDNFTYFLRFYRIKCKKLQCTCETIKGLVFKTILVFSEISRICFPQIFWEFSEFFWEFFGNWQKLLGVQRFNTH